MLKSRLAAFLPLVLFIVAALAVGTVFRFPLVTDDPFITYRYAQNLIGGTGFVFNGGETILSTTTPLYALVLAVAGLLRLDIPTVGYWLSVVSLGVAAFWLYALAAQVKQMWGGIVAGALLLAAPALVMTFGLETAFYVMLGLAAIWAYITRRVVLAFALGALLTLTRNDGVLVVLLLGVHYVWTRRAEIETALRGLRTNSRSLLQLLVPFVVYLVILLPWLLFAWLYFGSPFPFTLAAKVAQAQSGLWDPFFVGLVKWLRDNVLWLAPVLLFALIGIVWAIRQRALLLFVGAWALLHLAAYSLLRVAFYPWYVAPLIPALALFAGIGIERASVWLAAKMPAFPKPIQVAFVLLIGAILVAAELNADVSAGMRKPSPKVEAYEKTAQWLAANTPAGAAVDALEVGVIGYYDARPTYDFVGLVDPEQLPYLTGGKLADGVRRRAADYVVTIPPDAWLPRDLWFKDVYQAVQQIRVNGFYSGKPLIIYERAGAGETPSETIPLNAAFEKRIDLENVALYARAIQRGNVLPVRLQLRALDLLPKPESWKFTLQLVGAANHVVAQTDNFYPARLPEDGKAFTDYQGIPIPKNAPPGKYNLFLAMYDVQANERLSYYDANGNEVGDFLDLGSIEIKS